MAAIPRSDELADEWKDPQLLESVTAGATRIVLTEGQKMSVSPRLLAR